MKKIRFLLIITITFCAHVLIFAQDIGDIEIQLVQLQKVELTDYGIIAHYVNSKNRGAGIFLPTDWFRTHYHKEGELPYDGIVALRMFPTPRSRYPFLRIIYINGQCKRVELQLPNSHENIPVIEEDLPPEIIAKFEEQANLNYILIE